LSRAVPRRAVLLLQRDERAVCRDAGVAPRVLQQHQCQQSEHLRLVRHQLREQPAEAQRLVTDIAAHERLPTTRGVALVEDEIDDTQHRRQPVRELCVRGHPERDARVANLAAGAHQPLRHRRLRHEEGAGHLAGLQPRDDAQRQRHLRLDRERGVAAGEDQPQPVVGQRLAVRCGHLVALDQLLIRLDEPRQGLAPAS
jgi:hypothetical protein